MKQSFSLMCLKEKIHSKTDIAFIVARVLYNLLFALSDEVFFPCAVFPTKMQFISEVWVN